MTTTSNHTSTDRMQMTREEFLTRRQQAMALFQPIDRGRTLNVEAITTLIDWAEADEERRKTQYASWGDWRQSLWGLAKTDSANVKALFETDADKAGEEIADMGKNGVCGTAYCMAGQAVVQGGYALDFKEDTPDMWDGDTVGVSAENCVWQEPTNEINRWGRPVMREVGEPRDISDVAREILGITDEESNRFFDGSNGIRRLKQLANQFCAVRGLDEPYDFDESWDY